MATKNRLKTQKVVNKRSKGKNAYRKSFRKKVVGFLKDKRFHKVLGLFISLFSVFLFIAFISYLFTWRVDDAILKNNTVGVILFGDHAEGLANWMGRLGALLSFVFIKMWFGLAAFAFTLLFFVLGIRIMTNIKLLSLRKTVFHVSFWLLWLSIFLGLFFKTEPWDILGGVFGIETSNWLASFMGVFGLVLLLFFILAVYVIFTFNISPKKYFAKFSKNTGKTEKPDRTSMPVQNDSDQTENTDTFEQPVEEKVQTIEWEVDEKGEPHKNKKDDTSENTASSAENNKQISDLELEIEPIQKDDTPIKENLDKPSENDTEEKTPEQVLNSQPYNPRSELSDFQFPKIELLDAYSNGSAIVKNEELEANKNRIIQTLENYAISIDKIKATIGPTVTLYEIIPAPGIRISKIKNLEDDIALSLAALGIRIIAPMPGKGTIGIEVPNKNPEIVSMKSVLSSDKFQKNKFELPIGLGKTISNESFVTDLTKMPHLLMAGATGQGKSVGLNAILASLLYKKHPAELKFVLVDPKKVELSLFSKIERHYLAKLPDSEEAIITDTRKVVCTLNSLCIEMDNRYDLLKDGHVRNIKEYNNKFLSRRLNPQNGHRFLPYIVLIVDEFADLIMTAGKEIETPIARLAQLARAVGIHLIIATQRPSVNIITGTIKANFPARIAFRVTSRIDSRTILDSGGADQLIGRGDMLLSTGNEIIRLQCAFIDIHEVEKLTDFIGSQRAFPSALLLPEYVDEQSEGGSLADNGDRDDMFEEAARLIVTHQQGSTSLIQRKLKLGYNRAGRIIDQLESAGIVGHFEGSKAREVKIKDMVALEQLLNESKEI